MINSPMDDSVGSPLALHAIGIIPVSPVWCIATRTGKMRISSLRPGDFLECEYAGLKMPVLVTIDSPKLQRIVLDFGAGDEVSTTYAAAATSCFVLIFVGHGRRRAWWKLCPRFLQKWLKRHIFEFSAPRHKATHD
jgi:hypothetical protein